MGNKNETNVPFIVHETEMNRAERANKKTLDGDIYTFYWADGVNTF